MSRRRAFAVVVGIAFVVAPAVFAACGSDPSNVAGDSPFAPVPPGPDSCSRPHEGCPCATLGAAAPCGVEHKGPDGFVQCTYGATTCDGKQWGACVGESDVSPSAMQPGLHALGFGTPVACNTLPDASLPSGNLFVCIGGSKDGKECKNKPSDCPGGGVCTGFFGACKGGANDHAPCNVGTDCSSGNCQAHKGHCKGGPKDKDFCSDDSHCPTGFCQPPVAVDVCDPNCFVVTDDTDGGFEAGSGIVAADGGMTIDPNADAGVSGGIFASQPGGVSGCSPTNRNINGSACTVATGLTDCQQDFRCDPNTLQCVWNGGPGWYDTSVAGVDLTVGAPCGPSGSASATATVCNRGSAAAAAGSAITFHITNGASPPDACTNLGAPDHTFTLASALAPGACVSFSIDNSPGAKYVTVNAGAPGATAEAAGYCKNNSAYYKTDGSPGCGVCNNCSTKLTGTIKDPRGVNPLPGVNVFVPTKVPSALPTGPACDTCASLVTGAPWSLAVTDYKGSFSLEVPPGTSFPLTIQTGRWRRTVTVPAVAACTTAALPSGSSNLPTCASTNASCPGSGTKGDIPKMALTMSAGDHLECLLRKIGIDDTELTKDTGTGRVHLYTHNGLTIAGANNESTLWTAGKLADYSTVIAPCDNNHTAWTPGPTPSGPDYVNGPNPSATAAQSTAMKGFTDTGGRLFATHWFSYDFVAKNYPSAVKHVYGSRIDNDREAPSFDYTIDTTTPTGKTFADWTNYVGASPGGYGSVRFLSWRHLIESVSAPTIQLAYGDSSKPPVSHATNGSNYAGPMVSVYQVDTPLAPSPACGRIVVPMSHVSSLRASPPALSGTFPGDCEAANTAMTAQEKVFEFLFFSSQQCIGSAPTPPVIAPPPLQSVTVSRDYFAGCQPGEKVKWAPFYWEAFIPTNQTRIDFYAASAASQAALPATPGTQPTAQSRLVGTADVSVIAPQWDCDGCPSSPVTVDYHLKNDAPAPNDDSKQWLRVFMTFVPDNTKSPPVAPVLTAWRQLYDCVPNE
jgi:hypothetical protein